MRPALLSALVYVAATVIIGRQVLASLGSAIANDPGDPLLNAAILAWNATHVPWTDAWFQFPIFHPTADALTFSEHLLGVSLLASPIYWITGNPLTAYNLTLLLAFPLSGLAMYALVWRLTRQPAAAFLAGLAFAFAPYRVSHLPQIQVQMVFWAPLALLGLHRFVAEGRWRWLALFGIGWLLQGASNGYFLVYFSILVGLWALWFVVARKRWRDLALIAAAAAIASVPLIPILYRYVSALRDLGLSRNLGEIASYGADIAGLLCAAPQLTFWGWLHIACGPEGELFAGAALVTLCAAGAITRRRVRQDAARPQPEVAAPLFSDAPYVRLVRRLVLVVGAAFVVIAVSAVVAGPWRIDLGPLRASVSTVDKPMSTALAMLLIAFVLSPAFHRAIRRGSTTTFYLGAAMVCWVLAWGPFPRLFGAEALYQAPFAWLLQVPGVDGLRVPARFWMMSVLCLAVFLGLVVAPLFARLTRRTAAAAVAVAACGLLADGWTTVPAAPVPGPLPNAAAMYGHPVLTLPAGELYGELGDVAAVYRAVLGGWRSINGYSGYRPGYYDALRTLSRRTDSSLFTPFEEREDMYVLVAEDDTAMLAMVEAKPRMRLVARGNGVRQYRLGRGADDSRESPDAGGRRLVPTTLAASCDQAAVPFVTDADLRTEWVCGPAPEQTITVDLGHAQTVGSVVLALGPHASGFPRELEIQTSLDGAAWRSAWTGSPAGLALRAALASPRETRVPFSLTPVEARYVRLRQLDRTERFWSIAELELWSGTR